MRFWSPTDYTRRSSLWLVMISPADFFFFFFNDTATTEIYTLSLHDALPISLPSRADRGLPLGRFAGQPGGRLQNPRRAPQGHAGSRRAHLGADDRPEIRPGARRALRHARLQERARAARRDRGQLGRQAAGARALRRSFLL